MNRYNPSEIEPKWQRTWADHKLYKAVDFDEIRQKYVMLTEFPYPSGDGLHMGHVREYTLGDIIARHKRMLGYNVLYPMGYDAFGLPTENYAIKHNIPPQLATERNVGNFQKQFDSLGYSIDWERSFRTADPDYYKWTQWLFLQFFKAGLAYQQETAINWCPKCKTGLANEEVVNGRHERCDTPVEKKQLKQWLLGITRYADRLIDGLQHVDYPSRIADQQINWIGRSKGAEVTFKLAGSNKAISVFTTRPDTLYGATFMVLAPEHPLVRTIVTDDCREQVEAYIRQAQAKSEIERQDTGREKTGVFTGSYAINPATKEQIPVWIADYVLTGYGTGAIMAVPAHDERDYQFARKFNLPIKQVVMPVENDQHNKPKKDKEFTTRNVVMCLIEHPAGKKFLTLRWKNHPWHNFVMGGIEDGENPEAAGRREIAEETGFKNLEIIDEMPYQVNSHFYAAHKDVNRDIVTTVFRFKLADLAQGATQRDSYEQFDIEWTDEQELSALEPVAELPYILDWLQGKNTFAGEGKMINSGPYDGMPSAEAREKIVADLSAEGMATERINYRLRDWIFSRQHYWGEPIPIIHCQTDGAVPVPDDQLPVTLPVVEAYEPNDSGESPLAAIDSWVHVKCPVCGGPATRETDTMPNWAGSSWYYLRYFDAHNDTEFAGRKKLDYWGEVDLYLGGMEHTTLHLLYSRFWHQFLYDQGLVPTPEPYRARRGQGIILATDGSKMSKSKGNVVNPTDIINQGYGADALRMAIAFLAPYDMTTPWSPESVAGSYRFLNRVWTLTQEYMEPSSTAASDGPAVLRAAHRVIKKVSEDIEHMSFNTAIAALMEYVNKLYKLKSRGIGGDGWKFAITSLVQLTAPFAPHIADELWSQMGHERSVHTAAWPKWSSEYLHDDIIRLAVQVNGKLRAEIEVAKQSREDQVTSLALAHDNVRQFVGQKEPARIIYVPGRLVNIVVK